MREKDMKNILKKHNDSITSAREKKNKFDKI